jgi:hypothetical protein
LVIVGYSNSRAILIVVAKVNATSITSIIGRISIIARIVISLISCKISLIIKVRVAISASDKSCYKIRDFSIISIAFTGFNIAY